MNKREQIEERIRELREEETRIRARIQELFTERDRVEKDGELITYRLTGGWNADLWALQENSYSAAG